METPWDRAKKRPKYAEQEARTAKKPGARAQLNSGRTWSGLRDVIMDSPLGRILIDNKTTEKPSYTLTEDEWKGLKRDANRTPPGCHPALQVDIKGTRLFIIEDPLWDEIQEYIRTLEGMLEQGAEKQN